MSAQGRGSRLLGGSDLSLKAGTGLCGQWAPGSLFPSLLPSWIVTGPS